MYKEALQLNTLISGYRLAVSKLVFNMELTPPSLTSFSGDVLKQKDINEIKLLKEISDDYFESYIALLGSMGR